MIAEQSLPAVLLLGTGHWANPGRDVFNIRYDDMLSSQRQREIAECVERLVRFQPTKVAVEVSTDLDEHVTQEYRRYREGSFALTASEVHQLGFQVAAALGHERVYAIDWNEAIGYAHDMGVVFAFAQAHQPELYEELMGGGQRALDVAQAAMERRSVREMLLDGNTAEALARNHRYYLVMARVGEGRNYPGIGWVQGWYARNLRIYVNLTRIITSPRDHILVIYGAGHIPLLMQFLRDSGDYVLEALESYLR